MRGSKHQGRGIIGRGMKFIPLPYIPLPLLLCVLCGCGAWQWGKEARDYQYRLAHPKPWQGPAEITNVVGETTDRGDGE